MNRTMTFLIAAMMATLAGCMSPMARDYHALSVGVGVDQDASKPASRLDPLPEESPKLAAIDPRKVIYTASLTIATADPRSSVDQASQLAQRLGGYMQKMTNDAIVIRVPAKSFDEAMDALAEIGTIIDRQVTARDVTEEYTDQVTQLKNAKALLGKLQALLDKATTVEDALAIERQIARVQTEIDKLTGRLNSLGSRVAYATLTISFVPGQAIPAAMKLRLPFWWLSRLGLAELMSF